MVKILRWKDGQPSNDKITPKEWQVYTKHLIETNLTQGKDKTMEKLREIKDQIQENNGFA